MSRNKKPRNKPYRPRTASPDGGLTVIAMKHAVAEDRRPIQDLAATDLAAAYWIALDIMVDGQSGEEHWCTVVCALNVGMVLTERGIGADFEQAFVAALDGAFRAKVRADRTGIWRFDGEALQAIRTAFAIHDEQILLATKEEMRKALVEVRRRVDAGHVYQLEAA